MPVTTTWTPRRTSAAQRIWFPVWLVALALSVAALARLARLGLHSPPLGSLPDWPAWFAARPLMTGMFGLLRLLAVAVGGYLVLITALALLVRLTGDLRAMSL